MVDTAKVYMRGCVLDIIRDVNKITIVCESVDDELRGFLNIQMPTNPYIECIRSVSSPQWDSEILYINGGNYRSDGHSVSKRFINAEEAKRVMSILASAGSSAPVVVVEEPQPSYSHCGEDVLIYNMFSKIHRTGIYIIDIGSSDGNEPNNYKLFMDKKRSRVLCIEPDRVKAQALKDTFSNHSEQTFKIATLAASDKAQFLPINGHNIFAMETNYLLRQATSGIIDNSQLDLININVEHHASEIVNGIFNPKEKLYGCDDHYNFRPKVITVKTHDEKVERIVCGKGYKVKEKTDASMVFIHDGLFGC